MARPPEVKESGFMGFKRQQEGQRELVFLLF